MGPARLRGAQGNPRGAGARRLGALITSDAGERGARLAARLAARVAHDLNNALAVFSGHIHLLRESEEPLSEGLDAMEKALDNVARLARNLGDVGALGIEDPRRLDVNDLVRTAIRGIPEKDLEAALDASVASVIAREGDVSRALHALLQNAREANGGTGRVRIATGEEADEVRVVVEDAGGGIPEVVRRRDFDPLFSTSGQRGRGLGITIASLAAMIAGGRLTLENRPGGGTRASLALPRGAPR